MVLTVFMSAVDKSLTYIPLGAAVLAYFINYDPVYSSVAAFTVATFFSLVSRLVRVGRSS